MPRVGLIGDPVAHSLSPVMHRAAFDALGIDATYELWRTEASALDARVAALRLPGILGANVTVPHKQAVVALCDTISETAARIGAVNTIVVRDDALHGDNTDAYGFQRALDNLPGTRYGRAVILGAGGAARAVAVALAETGARAIRIVNRTGERAGALAAALTGRGLAGIEAVPWDRLDQELPEADMLVNATAVGWHGDECPLPVELLDLLPEGASIVDLTYRDTALLRAAREGGIPAIDGLGMLVHQGARSLELWTGHSAPVGVMRAAVLAEQGRRP